MLPCIMFRQVNSSGCHIDILLRQMDERKKQTTSHRDIASMKHTEAVAAEVRAQAREVLGYVLWSRINSFNSYKTTNVPVPIATACPLDLDTRISAMKIRLPVFTIQPSA